MAPCKRSKRFGVEKEMKESKSGIASAKPTSRERLHHPIYVYRPQSRRRSKRSDEGRDYLSLKLLTDQMRRFSQPVRETDGAGSLLMCCGCENRLRIAPDCSARIERAGLGEDGQAGPRRAANEDRAEAGEDLTPDQ